MITRYFSFTIPIKHLPDGRRYIYAVKSNFLFEAYPHGGTYFWSIKQLKDRTSENHLRDAYNRKSVLLSSDIFEVVQMGENPDFDWVYNTCMVFLDAYKEKNRQQRKEDRLYKEHTHNVRQIPEQQDMEREEGTEEEIPQGQGN